MASFGGAPKCYVCSKSVYPQEKITIGKKEFHKQCLKCNVCKRSLKTNNYVHYGGFFYCEPHYTSILAKGTGFNSFSEDVNEGPITTITDDAYLHIFRFLDRKHVALMKLISWRLHNVSATVDRVYPQKVDILLAKTSRNHVLSLKWRLSRDINTRLETKFHVKIVKHPSFGGEVLKTPLIVDTLKEKQELDINIKSLSDHKYQVPFDLWIVATNKNGYETLSEKKSLFLIASGHKHPVGCFDGQALLWMADGSLKKAKDVAVGDSVMTGSFDTQRVVKVQAIDELTAKRMVYLDDFWITRGHPVLINGEWYRPDEIAEATTRVADGLYNFVLADEHSVLVGEKKLVCCTLGKYCGPRLEAMYPNQNKLYGPTQC